MYYMGVELAYVLWICFGLTAFQDWHLWHLFESDLACYKECKFRAWGSQTGNVIIKNTKQQDQESLKQQACLFGTTVKQLFEAPHPISECLVSGLTIFFLPWDAAVENSNILIHTIHVEEPDGIADLCLSQIYLLQIFSEGTSKWTIYL